MKKNSNRLQKELRKVAACLVVVILGLTNTSAQGQGEIESVQYEIVVEKKITLPQASRNYTKIPPRAVEPIKPEITYEFKNLNFKAGEFIPTIRPLRLQNESISKLYRNYVKAGFGNYTSPYLAAYFSSKRDREKFLSASLFHQSFGTGAVDDDFSASGQTSFRLSGSAFGKHVTATGFAEYDYENMFFYGYGVKPADRASIKQSYGIFKAGGEIKNTSTSDFNYKLGTSFSYLTDHYAAKESELGVNFASDYAMKKGGKIIFGSDYYLIARKDQQREAKPRHLLLATAAYKWSPLDKLQMTLGTNVAVENDTIGGNKSFHVYPNINAQYELGRKIETYASLTGNMEKATLQSLSRDNRWVNANIDIFHTNRTLDFTVGLRASVGAKASFHTGVSIARLKDLFFFQNEQANASKFNVYYDNGVTTRTNAFADFTYMNSTKLKFNLRGDVFTYETAIAGLVAKESTFPTASVSESGIALHRPTFRVNGNLHYNIYDKLILQVNVIGQGGMKAIDYSISTPTQLKVVEIKTAIDANVGFDYLVSKQFSVFLKLNNVFSNQYQMFLNYPVRGFQAVAGVSWSF